MKKAIREGEIKVGDLILKVYVLDDGERVIEEKSFIAFMKAFETGELFNTQEAADKFVKQLTSI